MIDDPLTLIAAFASGLPLGGAYLGSLWLVLRRLPRSRRPGLWLLGSAAARVTLLLGAWYGVSGGRWDGRWACLAGFLVVRVAAARVARAGIGQPLAT